MSRTEVSADTLSITHIFDGEEVVTGGDDGQVWIGTFASHVQAVEFVTYLQTRTNGRVIGISRADK
jgi:hypothetical protein